MANNFISGKRFRDSRRGSQSVDGAAVSDRGRVVFSEPFRLMNQKAQVFSLDDSPTVRTRLTHSLEVAHLGRYIANSCFSTIGDRKKEIGISDVASENAAVTFVETACLLHDIGNPPFGHFGENVIKHWFKERKPEFRKSLKLADDSDTKQSKAFDKYYRDFTKFDGNPQGFRIVSKLEWNHDENGLNLTLTQLAVLLKYAVGPDKIDGEDKPKKPGFFHVDESLINSVWTGLEMSKARHPLSYIMEAADDLAYCLSDIEDGIDKGLVSGVEIQKAIEQSSSDCLKQIYRECQFKFDEKDILEQQGYDKRVFLDIKTMVSNEVIKDFGETFGNNFERVLTGELPSLLSQSDTAKEMLGVFKQLATKYLYDSKIVRRNEVVANRILRGLLDAYFPLLNCSKERFGSIMQMVDQDGEEKPITFEHALFRQISNKNIEVYRNDLENNDFVRQQKIVKEWILRAHLIVDHVSGMTDIEAMKAYKLICTGQQ